MEAVGRWRNSRESIMRDMGCHGGHGKIREAMRLQHVRVVDTEKKWEAVGGRRQIREARRMRDVRS
jgi:hypothetical protein